MSSHPVTHIVRIARTTLVACACLMATAGARADADDLPVLGDASSGIVSPQVERELGQDFLRQIRAQLPTENDPLLVYWTELLLYRLAVASELDNPDLSLVLIDAPSINAFAAPGGIVGINLGTFAQARNVHDFSAIVAHELAHLSQRHFARGIEEQRKLNVPMVAALLASVALMATAGTDAGMAALAGSQAALQDSQLRYSRSREREADRLGIETLARAGMNPWAMASMFERMQDVNRFTRVPPEFLLTHPVTESRVADARAQASEYPRASFADELEFQLMRARIQVHQAETPGDAVVEFSSRLEEGRTSSPDAARYGLAVAQLAAGEPEAARETLDPLLEAPSPSIAYVALASEIDVESGASEAGIQRLQQALQQAPGNLPLSMSLADALSRSGDHAAAQEVLETLATQRPNDDRIWYELAETSGLAGDIIAVHRARAEFFQLRGNLPNALQHLRYALQLVEGDYTMNARINQRVQDIREMRARLSG